jgi:hypothetical protein
MVYVQIGELGKELYLSLSPAEAATLGASLTDVSRQAIDHAKKLKLLTL